MSGPIYTIGYEGQGIDVFIDALKKHGVKMIADTRELPISRKPGFSKKILAARLAENGIEYVHFKMLGSPKDVRNDYRASHDWTSFRAAYLEHLKDQQALLDQIKELMTKQRCCLLCFESDPLTCHRSIITDQLADTESEDLQVLHIRFSA